MTCHTQSLTSVVIYAVCLAVGLGRIRILGNLPDVDDNFVGKDEYREGICFSEPTLSSLTKYLRAIS